MKPFQIVSNARTIIAEYDCLLTHRQLFYQFVARGLIENSHRAFKHIGESLSRARLLGDFPLEGLADPARRTHGADVYDTCTDLQQALDALQGEVKTAPERLLRVARWWGQPDHVSVWIEKETLLETFEGPCRELGVNYFVCKGNPSIASLARWMDSMHLAQKSPYNRRHLLLYFGDHDPTGWEVPRAALRKLAQIKSIRAPNLRWVEFKRVALNMDQINEHSPPPFPSKTVPLASYVREHATDVVWELDALPPDVLRAILRREVAKYFDDDVFQTRQAQLRTVQSEMRQVLTSTNFLLEAREDL